MNRGVWLVYASTLVLLAACSKGGAASICSPAAGPSAAANGQPPDTQQRGHDLCKEIEATYTRLKAAGTLQQSSDLTQLVMKYVPVNSSFAAAEEILRYAGFQVGHLDPDQEAHAAEFAYVSGRLGLSPAWDLGLCGASAFVDLYPRARGDHSAIWRVRADIAVICP